MKNTLKKIKKSKKIKKLKKSLRIKNKETRKIIKHETKRSVFIKFLLILLIFIGYFVFIAMKYGVKDGFLVTLLSWSFFVLCTPVADAGFLIDFPFRLITKVRMVYSEIIVWAIAIFLNVYAFFIQPEVYEKTKILLLFRYILEQPFPFWSIIIISGIGTFMSIRFGDELIDKAKYRQRRLYNKQKYRFKFFGMVFVFLLSVILYDFLLKQLGVQIPM